MNFNHVRGFTRINSEAQAYQVLRWFLKKRRLMGSKIRQDKRVYAYATHREDNIRVGSYYQIQHTKNHGTYFICYSPELFQPMVDKALELAVMQTGDLNLADKLRKFVQNGSIESMCDAAIFTYLCADGDPLQLLPFGELGEQAYKDYVELGQVGKDFWNKFLQEIENE
jgi:hypothetical protein